MKKVLKILSVVLTVALLIGIFSCATPVFAAEVTERDSINSTVEQLKTQVENSKNKSLYEIEEERDRFTKVFQNSDGTKTAIISATPIHYDTNDGWKDIDNTLIEETNDSGNVYKNKKNDFTVTIPKEITSSNELKIEKENYTISFELEGSDLFSKNKKIKGNKKNKKVKSTITQNEIDTVFLDKTSGISFENVGENTSVEYEITSTGLKENIILNKKPEEQVTYKYKITAKKLDAQLNANNSITFKNAEGKAVFEIPSPVMYDTENNISNDIDVGFSGKNGKYTLVYKPSFEWLSSDLTYPVVIDPVINTMDEEIGVKDTVVSSIEPTTNFNEAILLSTYNTDAGKLYSYIDLATSYAVKNGAKIKNVILGLYYLGGEFTDSGTTVAAYTVTSPWSASTVTYDTKATTINYLIDRRDINSATEEGYILFDVTEAYTLNQETYGVCVRQRDNFTDDVHLLFASSEYPTATQQPFFIIEYYETQGVEEQFDYHAFDAGRAGTAHFNDFTEQVYIERDELGLSGINMPVQIKRYFNSGLGGTYAINHYAIADFVSTYGIGWRTNYNQMIEYHNDIDEKEAILYCDGNGQTTYFQKEVTETSTTWKEMPDKFSNSQGYTIEIPTQYNDDVGNNLQYVKIKDSAGQIYEFNSDGLLVKINSAEADSTDCITITYVENNFLINKITDGAGREYRFSYTEYEEWLFPLLTSIQAYSSSGAPITVTHNGEEVPYKITYTYNFSDYLDVEGIPTLASATYPDGETVYYTVNDNFVSLKNIDGYAVEFAFNDSNTVISEKVYGENEITNGGQLTITDENPYEKSFVDLNETKITKQFDMYGRTINTKNNGETNNSIARTYSDDYKAQGSVSYSFYNSYEQNYAEEGTNLITNGSFTTDLSGWDVSSEAKVTHNTTVDCVTNNETPGSLQIQGKQSSARYAYQIIDIENGVSGDEYRIDYFKNNGDYAHMLVDLAYLSTVIVQARNNVSGDEEWQSVALVEENSFNSNWQKYSYSFDIGFPYNEIKVILGYYYEYGTVWYDDINLVNTYKATANPSTDTETDTENTETSTETETENGNTETTEPETSPECSCLGCSTDNCPCVENCSDSCTEPTCNRGYSFENNSDGIKFSITDGEKTMAMEQNINENYYDSQVDLNGLYTGYSYNQLNSQLKSISNGEGYVTNFGYDAMSRLNKVSNSVDGLISGNKMETSYSYENDRIKSITHNGFSYNYEYNAWGNPRFVKVGEQPIVSYDYDTNNQTRDRVNTITYGNGDCTEYSYDENNGNITAITSYTEDELLVADYKYTYDSQGNLKTITNVTENTQIEYTDTGFDYKVLSNDGNTSSVIYSKNIQDDGKTVENLFGKEYTKYRINNSADTETEYSQAITVESPLYDYSILSQSDYFGRTQNKDFSYLYSEEDGYNVYFENSEEFTYTDKLVNEEERTTNLVSSYKTHAGAYVEITGEIDEDSEISEDTELLFNEKEYLYEYDYNGNITQISIKETNSLNVETITEICSYVYDSVGQVVRENNAELNKTFVYVYDKGGNIARKSEYAYTTGDLGEALSTVNYTYDTTWKDKLTGYGTTAIQTDAMGNPLNYVSKTVLGEDVSGTLEWNGRQLSAAVRNGSRYEYEYNSDGLRTSVKEYSHQNELAGIYYYFWDNGKLTGYYYDDQTSTNDATVKMIYDCEDKPIGYELINEDENYNEFMMFEKNLQGDIVGVLNGDGVKVISYSYDAWGNVTTTILGGVMETVKAILYTPITYRGYMYDFQLGLYYLQSRYYNPTYGRFLNADSIMKTGEPLGANIFAYCGNNPVNYVDYEGRDFVDFEAIRNALFAIVLVVVLEKILKDKNLSYILSYELVSINYSETIAGIYDLSITFLSESNISYNTYYSVKISVGTMQSWWYYCSFFESIYDSDWSLFYDTTSVVGLGIISHLQGWGWFKGIVVGLVEVFATHFLTTIFSKGIDELEEKLKKYGYASSLFRLEYINCTYLFKDGSTTALDVIDSPIYLFVYNSGCFYG